MSKDARLAIRFSQEDRGWLDSQAEFLGIGTASLVIMMVRQARQGASAAVSLPLTPTVRVLPTSSAVRVQPAEALPPSSFGSVASGDGGFRPDVDDVRAEEMDIPPDDDSEPSLEEVMRAAELTPQPRSGAIPARSAPLRTYRMQPGLQPNYGPGSRTRAVGVNPQVGSGNMLGDGHGNVLRDNFGHLGFTGTRAR